MTVSLKIMKSFVPTYKYRRPHSGEITNVPIVSAWCLLRNLRTAILIVMGLAIGSIMWIGLREYADMVITSYNVQAKPTDPPLKLLRKSIHFKHSTDVILTEQQHRKAQIKKACSKENEEPKFLSAQQKSHLYQRMFVDHKQKFVYCSVPKAACTKWKQIILKSSGIPGQYQQQNIEDIFPHYDVHFRRLSDLSTVKALQALDYYYIFTFVRDPLVRVVSAWRDKFQHHSKENRSDYIHFHHEYGRHIMKRYRAKFSAQELERGFPISFREYIDYITSFSNPNEMNEHWIPSTNLCRPCHVDYNFIGKTEEQKLESEYLIDTLQLSSYVPTDFFRGVGSTSKDEAKRLLKDISLDKKRILLELYSDDASIFGYDLEEFLQL